MKKYFSILFVTFILTQCSNSAKNNAITSGKSNNTNNSVCVKDSLNKRNEVAMTSEITCPKCQHKKIETMPTDVCIIRYNCENCLTEMRPKDGDCCVFCPYGTYKCPSMQ